MHYTCLLCHQVILNGIASIRHAQLIAEQFISRNSSWRQFIATSIHRKVNSSWYKFVAASVHHSENISKGDDDFFFFRYSELPIINMLQANFRHRYILYKYFSLFFSCFSPKIAIIKMERKFFIRDFCEVSTSEHKSLMN